MSSTAMSLLPRSCCCCVRIPSKAPPSLGPAYRSRMSLPCSTAVGCVVQVRRSKSLCGNDDSHGQSPSRVCPSTPGVVGGIRPAAFDCEGGMVALCEPCEGSPSAVNVVMVWMVGFPTSILLEVRCQRLPVPPGANGGGIVRESALRVLHCRPNHS